VTWAKASGSNLLLENEREKTRDVGGETHLEGKELQKLKYRKFSPEIEKKKKLIQKG